MLSRRKRGGNTERERQRDDEAYSRHRALMPDDPTEQGREDRRAEDDPERGFRYVAARRQPCELAHDNLQIASQGGEIGSRLIRFSQS
jgi:hypothetical protein